jgi:hypothetical protein
MKNHLLAVLFLLTAIGVGLWVPQSVVADGGSFPTATITPSSTPVNTPTPSVTPVPPPTDAAPANIQGDTVLVTPTTQAAAKSVETPAPIFEIGWVGYCMIFVIVICWLALIGFAVYYFYKQSQNQPGSDE